MVALVATGMGACAKDDDAAAPRPVPTAAADAAPRDHLAPGELLEGPEKAFGIPLPQGVKVDSYFPPQILASGPAVKAADVANYLRARVTSGRVMVGAASTIFDHVQAEVSPGIAPGGRIADPTHLH